MTSSWSETLRWKWDGADTLELVTCWWTIEKLVNGHLNGHWAWADNLSSSGDQAMLSLFDGASPTSWAAGLLTWSTWMECQTYQAAPNMIPIIGTKRNPAKSWDTIPIRGIISNKSLAWAKATGETRSDLERCRFAKLRVVDWTVEWLLVLVVEWLSSQFIESNGPTITSNKLMNKLAFGVRFKSKAWPTLKSQAFSWPLVGSTPGKLNLKQLKMMVGVESVAATPSTNHWSPLLTMIHHD